MSDTIFLAGGCFWGVQGYFDLLHGVISTKVGYANSLVANPIYQQVCSGTTNAVEAIKIEYDSTRIPLFTNAREEGKLPECLLSRFFSIIDPTALNYQANDRGTQYRNGIYVLNENLIDGIKDFINTHIAPRYIITDKDREEYEKSGTLSKIVTEVQVLQNFYDAEEYHQKYLLKNPNGYCHIDISRAEQPL